jgi:hypothetical protein
MVTRSLVGAALLPALVLALSAPGGAVNAPALPQCTTVDVSTVGVIDSGLAKAGDAFRFRTVADVPAGPTYPAVPKDSNGFGIVIIAHHGASGGRPGFMIIDARFVRLADGTHVPVQIVPEPKRDTPYMQGRTANAPGYVGFIPFASYVTGAYNTLHHGREIVVPEGARLTLIVGDDLALGACRLPERFTAPSPSPAPQPGPTLLQATPQPPQTPLPPPAPMPAPTNSSGH